MRYCKKNHELTEDTVYIRKSGKLAGNWQCKICSKERTLKSKAAIDPKIEKQRLHQWYLNNKDAVVERAKEWAIKNPDKHREHYISMYHTRRLVYVKSPFPKEQWKSLLDEFKGFCGFCESYVDKLTVGHIVPISKGGLNNIENLAPQCSKCNTSQSAKLLHEWKPEKFINYLEAEAHV